LAPSPVRNPPPAPLFQRGEVNAYDYGFSLQGILGMDFLRHTKALINLDALTLT